MAAQVATGKTVEEAIANALRHLGCEREEADIEILEAASGGFLGIFGGHPAKVRATKKGRKHAAGRFDAGKTASVASGEKEIHNIPVDAVENANAKTASATGEAPLASPVKTEIPASAQKHVDIPAEAPEELTEALAMAAKNDAPDASDRPWMPPQESGAIDTPYSEQRSYAVAAVTP